MNAYYELNDVLSILCLNLLTPTTLGRWGFHHTGRQRGTRRIQVVLEPILLTTKLPIRDKLVDLTTDYIQRDAV